LQAVARSAPRRAGEAAPLFEEKVSSMSTQRSVASRSGASYSNIAYLAARKPSRMHLSLTNIAAILERLGNPQKRYPAILVAGTNGKGSVTTYVASVLRAMGLRVGAYYSPHIFRPHERIRLDGDEIASRELDALLGRIRRLSRGVPLTYFEYLTAVAAQHFLDRRVEAAVFEVGLGGRLDATNLVNAVVTVITGVSLDHREHLGRTKRDILAEKLGIARAGVPLAANLATRPLVAQAAAHCARTGAPFHSVREETASSIVELSPERMTVRVRTPRRDYGRLETRMIGRTQERNVATALRALELFREAGHLGRLDVRAVRKGIAAAFLAGRFQTVSRSPRVILDVSHNEESFLAALETLRRVSPPERTTIVFGALAHKELGAFPRRALKAAREIIVTRLGDPRGASGERLDSAFREARRRTGGARAEVRVAAGIACALREARRNAADGDTIVIMGSHVTIEEAARFL
jgi:dihydrofolate synthase/folylpolyglutamate synthase